MQKVRQQELKLENDRTLKGSSIQSHQKNLFYNNEVVTIRETLQLNLAQPYSNVNRSVQKYSGAQREQDELIQQVFQLQQEVKIRESENQKLRGEKEILLNSALSANQKLKANRGKDLNKLRDTVTQQTDNSITISQAYSCRDQRQLNNPSLIQFSISQEDFNYNDKSFEISNPDIFKITDVSNLQLRVVKLEQKVKELQLRIAAKDQGLIELINRVKQLDHSFDKNDFKKYYSLIDKEIGQLATIVEDNVTLTGKRFINIYRDDNEILGIVFSDEPKSTSSLVISQQIEGFIQSVDLLSAEGKCLQITVKTDIDGSRQEDSRSHLIVYPNESIQSKKQTINFQFPKEIIEEKQRFLQEIWFHELQQQKVLVAEISVKHVVVVDEKKLQRISSRINVANMHYSQSLEKPISFNDQFLNRIRETLRLHDIIIYTNQKYFYGIQAIYRDGKSFHQGNLMIGSQAKEINESDGIVAVNKVPKNRYSKSKELSSIQFYQNQATFLIEKMVLGYRTQNSSNQTTTNLQCELGETQTKNSYETTKIEIKQGMLIGVEFRYKKDGQHPSEILVSQINLF